MNDSNNGHQPALDEQQIASGHGLLVHVVTNDPHTLQDQLEEAVRTVREGARPENHGGILITRHSEALFTVTPSSAVPYGTTIEQDRWHLRR